MKKIKVTHIITCLDTGGAEMMLYKLLSAYDRERFEMSVISLIDIGMVGKKIESLGIKVYSLGMRKSLLSIFSLFKLRKILKQENPDILQGWMYHGNLIATIAKKLIGKPMIWNIRQTLYSFNKEKFLTGLIIRLCAWLSKRPEYIIYNSDISISQHQKIGYFKHKTKMIPNGFDCELLKPGIGKLRSELNLINNEVLIGLVARYHPMKCHKNFIKAAARLGKNNEVRFVLVGRTVDKFNDELMQEINRTNIADKFYLLGERSDIPNIFSSLDIVALTSSWGEGFPNVIGEAMACGIPCVVTDVGDAAKIVDNTGVVVAADDINILTKGLQYLIDIGEDKRRSLGVNARKRIKNDFSIAAVTEQYQNLYQELSK